MACGSRLDLQNTAAISALAWEYLECANGFVNTADPWKYARIPQEQRSRPSCLSLATLHNQRSVPNELGNPKKGLGTPLVTPGALAFLLPHGPNLGLCSCQIT